jgi:NAD(P)-dependent dehydrogenase (short-subunit alcohol dehydrogenase family)
MDPVASKRFSWDDQHSFASLSGDVNPMHMDPVAARRTSAGSPAVHGIHALVWAIDQLASRLPGRQIARIKADWSHFVRVGDTAELLAEPGTNVRLRAQIRVKSEIVAAITLFFGAKSPATPWEPINHSAVLSPTVPSDLELKSVSDQSGAVAFATPAAKAATWFPFAAGLAGAQPIAGLLALSRLVGMICPGLHSIFARLDVELVDGTSSDVILYRVTGVDERFRYLTEAVYGGGLSGTVEAFVRNAPTEQQEILELSKAVDPAEFRGSVALIIGGSRGIGEVTAKVLAAGGADVAISYNIGRADADRVASSIRSAGRSCEVIHYDARNTSTNQLSHLASLPTHVYYFATGPITPSRSASFDSDRFDEFCTFYVKGFAHLCACLRSDQPTVRVFYPSSVYVSAENRPGGLAEYAIAKAAGEALCAEINQSWPKIAIVSRRLPRILTDQTASFLQEEPSAPADSVMLAIIREMQASTPHMESAPRLADIENLHQG